MNIFKNKFVVILGTFLITLLVIGGTYAYYSWNTSDAQKTNVVFTVTQPNISASINGTGRYTASNLAPTSCTSDNNNIRETVMINYTNDTSYPVTLTANLSLTSFRLHNASYQPTQSELSALRWIISESNDNCTSNSSDIIIGNKFDVLTFNSGQVIPNNILPLSLGTIQFMIPENTTSSKTYYLYIWLDNTYTHENIGNVNSDPLQELTFTAQWDGKLEQYSGTSANTEGYPVTISNSQGFGLTDYKIYGNSIQNGTPVPSAPVAIQSVGNKNKNILKLATGTVTGNGITASNVDGNLSLSGTVTSSYLYIKISGNSLSLDTLATDIGAKYKNDGLLIKAGETKTLSLYRFTTPTRYIYVVYSDGAWQSISPNSNEVYTITAQKNITAIFIQYGFGTVLNHTLNIQLEDGSIGTSYVPYGYTIPINVRGKNILSYPYYNSTRTINGITFTDNGDGSITLNGTATDKSIHTQYTVKNSFSLDAGTYYISSSNSNCVLQFNISSYPKNSSFTISERKSAAIILQVNNNNSYVFNNEVVYPMIEYGSVKTTYESYYKPTTATIELDDPLRKIGDVADYIDYLSGKLYRRIGKYIILNGSDPGGSSSTYYQINNQISGANCALTDKNTAMSTHFSQGYVDATTTIISDFMIYNDKYIRFSKALGATSTDVQNFFNRQYQLGIPVEIYYQLKTPQEIPISLPKINTILGTNIISVDTTVNPSNMAVIYNNSN